MIVCCCTDRLAGFDAVTVHHEGVGAEGGEEDDVAGEPGRGARGTADDNTDEQADCNDDSGILIEAQP